MAESGYHIFRRETAVLWRYCGILKTTDPQNVGEISGPGEIAAIPVEGTELFTLVHMSIYEISEFVSNDSELPKGDSD